ncbi:MAG: hypothetical protein J6Z07_08495 [Lachnospiraceae bacterium]|nr:hypothetical protein [Lachnospiraceae bacterium]MBP5565102.1 hypothetical protein [Lachnospiraceae bacterium]
MKNSLSRNDKRLLLFMFLFVVIVGIGYWGIFPQIKAFRTLEKDIAREEALQAVNEQKVANEVFVESQCKEYEEMMSKDKDKFYDMMNEADIDLLLTSKAIKNKLESFNLNIDIDSEPSDRKAYRYSELYEQQQVWERERAIAESMESESEEDEILEDFSGSKKKKNSDEEEEEEIDETVDIFGNSELVGANTDIYAAKVTMTIGGDRANLEAFLKEIMESDKEILITSFAWSKYRVQKTKQGVIVTDKNKNSLKAEDYELVELDALTITMEIYMCDKD